MKTIIVLSVFCAVFGIIIIFLVWYIRKILNELLYISENIGDFLVVIDNYAEHLEKVYNMETYYGDETIQGMIQHTKAVVEEITQFESVYSLTTDLEENTEYEDEVEEEIDDEEEYIANSG
jgi:predicted PurR-regulated permease PerM